MLKYVLFFLPFVFAQNIMAQAFTGCATGKEVTSTHNESFDKQVLELVNKERKKRGMKPLEWNAQLANAARYHAQDMAMDDYMEHDSKDRKGTALKTVCGTFDRINKFVSGIFPCAENIAAGAETPEEVMRDWMNSSGHRKNILNKSAKYMGAGCYYNENSEFGLYWAQTFGY